MLLCWGQVKGGSMAKVAGCGQKVDSCFKLSWQRRLIKQDGGSSDFTLYSWHDVSGKICYFNEGAFLRGDPSSCSAEVSFDKSRRDLWRCVMVEMSLLLFGKKDFCLVSKFQENQWCIVLSQISGPKSLKIETSFTFVSTPGFHARRHWGGKSWPDISYFTHGRVQLL